jgi:hypothetical protein
MTHAHLSAAGLARTVQLSVADVHAVVRRRPVSNLGPCQHFCLDINTFACREGAESLLEQRPSARGAHACSAPPARTR